MSPKRIITHAAIDTRDGTFQGGGKQLARQMGDSRRGGARDLPRSRHGESTSLERPKFAAT